MSERKGTKALELWCKRLVRDCPNVQIDNMTTSWRNGIAFCALVHHFRPDLIDMSSLKPENIYENNQLAFNVAEKHLGIPALLDPEDMVENDVPDRLSILTYLSQFYQRLGHTVNTKASSEVEPKSSSASNSTPLKFGKSGLDKCAACGLPVYLAQRLIVSHKLYHRRCFRCSKCSGHLNPKNFEITDGSEFTCDSCKNEKTLSKFFNNNDHDQMGMLAFSDDLRKTPEVPKEESINVKIKTRPLSILEKINMFEKNSEKDVVTDKIANISLKDNTISKPRELSAPTIVSLAKESSGEGHSQTEADSKQTQENIAIVEHRHSLPDLPTKVYKSNVNKFNFLQTQLADDKLDDKTTPENLDTPKQDQNIESISSNIVKNEISEKETNSNLSINKEESNITDDIRLGIGHNSSNPDNTRLENNEVVKNELEQEVSISVPPRRKKQLSSPDRVVPKIVEKEDKKPDVKMYPDHLNPFSDDEEDEDEVKELSKKASTNPFGSDDEDDDVPPITNQPKASSNENQATPVKRLIKAYNPFWSDGEEPSTDDEEPHEQSSSSSKMYKSSIATSTPNLPSSAPRRKKAKAPPPPVITVTETPRLQPCTSMDDVVSISSLSSFNSTIHSDQKSIGVSTPRMKKKRPAPTPPDSLSTVSGFGSLEKGVDSSGLRSNASDGGRRSAKGPAPGLPLPERREVKLAMSPEELQVQLDLLETQQLGLERQGVLIEQMIRDKCEGDEPSTVPQEEVEDLVIQLCELVNEKNDLFRKQTELMYIRRQQRLEQEQADIEHEIRIIQSRPAVNRIDADKAREEQLVARLVEMVRLRDELVQQLDAERRRERQEDLAIAASIASKRGQYAVHTTGRDAGAAAGRRAPPRAPGGPRHRRLHRQQARSVCCPHYRPRRWCSSWTPSAAASARRTSPSPPPSPASAVSMLSTLQAATLVQQLDAERRRERQEDLAIAASIASKRGQYAVHTTGRDAGAAAGRRAPPRAPGGPRHRRLHRQQARSVCCPHYRPRRWCSSWTPSAAASARRTSPSPPPSPASAVSMLSTLQAATLVQQLDAERRRERQEDLAIAASIASKRGQYAVHTTGRDAGAAAGRRAPPRAPGGPRHRRLHRQQARPKKQ
ncbi:MICAL-like protein 1 isoform X3 [Ostrinia nubilalis]|uniref:MICAL-like protein 1 isoform X3 n=1 Tax=Ostrinia nubilalis TaxID=29057 RepID=UPI0030826A46